MERKFRYKYVVDEEKRTIVALSSFAGDPVRGVARCDPQDAFMIEEGKELAEARCSVKIAHKRLRRAETMLKWAQEGLEYFTKMVAKYTKYEADAIQGIKVATAALANVEKKFK